LAANGSAKRGNAVVAGGSYQVSMTRRRWRLKPRFGSGNREGCRRRRRRRTCAQRCNDGTGRRRPSEANVLGQRRRTVVRKTRGGGG